MRTCDDSVKRCTVCGDAKGLDDFHKKSGSRDGLQPACKQCAKKRAADWYRSNRERANAASRARVARLREVDADGVRLIQRERSRSWRERNPEKVRANGRRRTLKRYGLTPEAFDAMLAEQGGRCAVCRTAEPGGTGTWHVDHDHACCAEEARSCGHCVRGLLCGRCNTALAMVDDDLDHLAALALYVRRAQLYANL